MNPLLDDLPLRTVLGTAKYLELTIPEEIKQHNALQTIETMYRRS